MSTILQQIREEERQWLKKHQNPLHARPLTPKRSRSTPQNPLNAATLKPDNPFCKPNPLPFKSRLDQLKREMAQ